MPQPSNSPLPESRSSEWQASEQIYHEETRTRRPKDIKEDTTQTMSTPGAARSVASSTSTPAQVQNASSAPASAVPSSGDGGERVPATAKFNGNKLEIHIGGKGNALTFSGEPTNGTRLVGMDAWSAASTGTIDRRPGAGDYEFSASYREDKIYVKLKCTDNSSLPDIQYIGRPDVITGKGTVS